MDLPLLVSKASKPDWRKYALARQRPPSLAIGVLIEIENGNARYAPRIRPQNLPTDQHNLQPKKRKAIGLPRQINTSPSVVVAGAGPAGLGAAYMLAKGGCGVQVFERNQIVGGISRTENYKGFRFDLGGHRFYTKLPEVDQFWREVLGKEFLKRPRKSRIYFKSHFIDYPLKPLDAMKKMGPLESIAITGSFIWAKLFPHPREDNFEQWVTNRFGSRLFNRFFKSYTEKVWGISTDRLSADWAEQRIKDMSLLKAIVASFDRNSRQVRSLIEEFDYPRFGPGMLWNAVADGVSALGGSVDLNCEIVEIKHASGTVNTIVGEHHGHRNEIRVDHFISSMPVGELIQKMSPAPPETVRDAASRLRHRALIVVGLIIDEPFLFPDNWIYIHDSGVKVGRIQNFKNWSADMVANPNATSLGLEYFCNTDDALWALTDSELVQLASDELSKIGLAETAQLSDGCVFRVPQAYPVYDENYREAVETIREYIASFTNLQTIGRNGLHRYDNQDHATLSGMYAAHNFLHGEANDPWSINTEPEFLETQTNDAGGINRLRRGKGIGPRASER